MSSFAPMALSAGPDSKNQLLQRLMQQYQEHAARAAGLAGTAGAASAPTVGGGFNFAHTHPFGGAGHITGAVPNFIASLMARLGPGGFGVPIGGRETSPGAGAPTNGGIFANPHAGGGVNAPDHGSPPVSIAPQPASPSANPFPLGAPTPQPMASAVQNAFSTSSSSPIAASPGAALSLPGAGGLPGIIPLGNGLIYHPALGITSISGTKTSVM